MGPETTSESNFAFEAFMPLGLIALLGVLLLGICWWMARRDRHFVDHPKLVWLLAVLRTCAIVILIWMLAGPTLVTTLRKFKRKSIAVLVDTSASMGLVDAADGSGNVSRWAASGGSDPNAVRLQQVDSAVATLLAAQRQLEQFGKLPAGTKETAAARALFSRSVEGRTTLPRCRQRLLRVAETGQAALRRITRQPRSDGLCRPVGTLAFS